MLNRLQPTVYKTPISIKKSDFSKLVHSDKTKIIHRLFSQTVPILGHSDTLI